MFDRKRNLVLTLSSNIYNSEPLNPNIHQLKVRTLIETRIVIRTKAFINFLPFH